MARGGVWEKNGGKVSEGETSLSGGAEPRKSRFPSEGKSQGATC
jgi:hypothetical protein